MNNREPTGSHVVPVGHRDYTLDVPAYRYDLPCGHRVFYRTPVEVNEYGYCRQCKDYWQRDHTVEEHAPRGKKLRLSDRQLAERIDDAILKNRIADILIWRDGWSSSAEEVAQIVGCNRKTVLMVMSDLGLQPEQFYEEAA